MILFSTCAQSKIVRRVFYIQQRSAVKAETLRFQKLLCPDHLGQFTPAEERVIKEFSLWARRAVDGWKRGCDISTLFVTTDPSSNVAIVYQTDGDISSSVSPS